MVLPATLTNFAAVVDTRENHVILFWQTEMEFGNLGFLLSCSRQWDDDYTQIAWIESAGISG